MRPRIAIPVLALSVVVLAGLGLGSIVAREKPRKESRPQPLPRGTEIGITGLALIPWDTPESLGRRAPRVQGNPPPPPDRPRDVARPPYHVYWPTDARVDRSQDPALEEAYQVLKRHHPVP
jgi:hypothetical protein